MFDKPTVGCNGGKRGILRGYCRIWYTVWKEKEGIL